jgi:hypothetical protein
MIQGPLMIGHIFFFSALLWRFVSYQRLYDKMPTIAPGVYRGDVLTLVSLNRRME